MTTNGNLQFSLPTSTMTLIEESAARGGITPWEWLVDALTRLAELTEDAPDDDTPSGSDSGAS